MRWWPMSDAPADAVALARTVIAAAGRHLGFGGQAASVPGPTTEVAPVDVSVVQGGEPISQLSGVADHEDGGCCGDVWVVRPS